MHSENKVAPTTGAWIETLYPTKLQPEGNVAPTTGAWIETAADG